MDDDVMSEEEAETLSYDEKARLIQSDPITTARYFDHRFRELKKTWVAEDGPFCEYKISEHYFRIEFQHRGSPHVHMLIWLEDAPIYEDKECDTVDEAREVKKLICDFVDKIITFSKKWDGSPHTNDASRSNIDTWKSLLKTRQTHKHTSTCRRKRGGNDIVCRFNIPFMPMPYTKIMLPLDHSDYTPEETSEYKKMHKGSKDYLDENSTMLSDSEISFVTFLELVNVPCPAEYFFCIEISKIYIKREPNEVMINNYSRKILSLFKANMDIQFILDPYACCAYVLDYINKTDKGMSKAMEGVYAKHKDDPKCKAFDLLKSLLTTYYNASKISAQEAAYNIIGIRIFESSTVTIFVPTSRPENRTHILKSQVDLLKLSPDSTDCFIPGVIEHYVNCPDSLENITLAQFASYYEVSKKHPSKNKKSRKRDDEENEDEAESENEETLQADTVEDVFFLCGGSPGEVFELKKDSGFIRRRSKDEAMEFLDVDTEKKFLENQNNIVFIKKEFCTIDDETLDGYMEQLNGEMEENETGSEDMGNSNQTSIKSCDANNDFKRYTLDVDDSSEGDYHRSNDLFDDLNESTSRSNNGNKTYLEKITLADRLGKEQFYALLSKLNRFGNEYSPVLLTAPTGKAAFNIQGQTLHNAFQLPVSQNDNAALGALSASVSHFMSVGLKDVRVLIIDEISMVGVKIFGLIDQRLRTIFDATLPFGGISVIVLGDFFQLSPVAAKPLYTSKQIMRQRDDLQFSIALNNMAVGKMTPQDINLFQSRVLPMTVEEMNLLSCGENMHPHLRVNVDQLSEERPICLFHRNADVKSMNNAILDNMDTEGSISVCFDRATGGKTTASEKKFALELVRDDNSTHSLKNRSLLKQLKLKISARYMIMTNISTADGIVNGTTGYLKKIDYGRLKNTSASSSSAAVNKKPLRLWIKFDDERSGLGLRKNQALLREINNTIDDRWTMIEPVSLAITKVASLGITINRKQFPIVPAEALTIHKSQGGTYKNVVVYNYGGSKMSRSLIYVACSRATTASGLRQKTIVLNPVFRGLTEKKSFQILSRNVQSLQDHFNQIVNDPVYISSDVILLNETWTLCDDCFDIPGFKMVSSANCLGTVRKPLGSRCYISDKLGNNYASQLELFIGDNNSSVSVSFVTVDSSLYCSIYASPRTSQQLLLETLNFVVDQDYDYIVIAGDFNVNFNEESSKKSAILNLLEQKGLKSSLPSTVISTTKQKTLIDNIFNNKEILDSGTYISFTSYHEPLWLLT
ncbi:hypothetical protein INT47_007461 [Mucor saturninus]|uniref:ATP-dependent DNA helicase n=1 Tax=Mucor saturninus TaxID=64648 RepID=A0A8H7UWW8_9FUNG|nr:hypothetical protein INT47_007461 [Mucor saturninus]